jgi:dihydrofolate synthase / folylpolyglutamate synthase
VKDYSDALNYLYNQLPFYQRSGPAAYKDNLYNTLALDKMFGNPHKRFRSVHIAGTNGKGSVSHMIASILMEAGYKTGLYTSPHLKDFRERIRINGEMIRKEFVLEFINEFLNKNETIQMEPSFFELTVMMAFDYFAREKIDIAVVEVGLGGRLDSTNIITPVLSVITNISYDHTDLLGDTLGKIAVEKAGIIKRFVPVVIGETHPETEAIFKGVAKKFEAPLTFADQNFKVDDSTYASDNRQIFNVTEISRDARRASQLDHTDTTPSSQTYQTDARRASLLNAEMVYANLRLDLLGKYQSKNICTLLAAVDELNRLKLNISDTVLRKGLENVTVNTGLQGRWQKLNDKPLIICDIAHNTGGIREVVEQLYTISRGRLHLIIGMVKDKDIKGVLKLLPKDAAYYFTKASIPRALDEKKLMKQASDFNLKGKSYPTVKKAFETARKKSSPDDLIIITGSTFVVAEVLP